MLGTQVNNCNINVTIFKVLKALSWDKVNIEVVMVELEHAGKVIFALLGFLTRQPFAAQISCNGAPLSVVNPCSLSCLFLLFQVFPGSRRDVHLFMQEKGFDYVGSLFEDDLFIRKDLNTPERYPKIPH